MTCSAFFVWICLYISFHSSTPHCFVGPFAPLPASVCDRVCPASCSVRQVGNSCTTPLLQLAPRDPINTDPMGNCSVIYGISPLRAVVTFLPLALCGSCCPPLLLWALQKRATTLWQTGVTGVVRLVTIAPLSQITVSIRAFPPLDHD